VASPRLTSLATSEEVNPEELGGWRVHAQTTGLVDQITDTDAEAVEAVRRFLSYMPFHNGEAPPVAEVPQGSDEACERMLEILPESRNQVYDARRVVACICDRDSVFEMKARFGRSIVTALGRIDGRTVGFIANNPMVKGGAIDPDACDKAVSFLVLCDSFNIPIVLLVDQPGFLVGVQGEARRAVGKVMNWMNALSLVTVPRISMVMRKSYGQAVLNMGGAGNADEVAAWLTAEVSFMEPQYGAVIAFGVRPDGDPEAFRDAVAKMTKDTSAYDLAACYGAQAVIDPRESRQYLRETLRNHWPAPDGGVGRHMMRTWPTSF
jgi:acetyl-CoA carboxylase carboxyltransferase component